MRKQQRQYYLAVLHMTNSSLLLVLGMSQNHVMQRNPLPSDTAHRNSGWLTQWRSQTPNTYAKFSLALHVARGEQLAPSVAAAVLAVKDELGVPT